MIKPSWFFQPRLFHSNLYLYLCDKVGVLYLFDKAGVLYICDKDSVLHLCDKVGVLYLGDKDGVLYLCDKDECDEGPAGRSNLCSCSAVEEGSCLTTDPRHAHLK